MSSLTSTTPQNAPSLSDPITGNTTAVVGLQWANRMHGFGDEEDQPVEP